MSDLLGKVAVVTGAAKRIGAVVAGALADAGCDIVIHYRHSQQEAAATTARIVATGRRAIAVPGDLRRRDASQRLLEETLTTFGRADILVANASVFRRTPLASVTETDWDDMIDNNLRATFWPLQCFGSHMQAAGDGVIVTLADTAAARPWIGYAPYCAAKAGVVALTLGLAKELAPQVRVNAIAPGPIAFPDDFDAAERDREIDRTLLKRQGSPEHIAAAVLALVRNDYITGAVLPVDGGRGLT